MTCAMSRPALGLWIRLALGLALTASAGCRDDDAESGGAGADAYSGVYQTTSQTKSEGTCDGEGDAVSDGDAFFKLTSQSVLGMAYLSYHSCASAGECEDATEMKWAFDKKVGEVWSGDGMQAVSGSDSCILTINPNTATLAGDELTLERRMLRGTVPPPEGKTCTDEGVLKELVTKHRDELTCVSRETIKAKRAK